MEVRPSRIMAAKRTNKERPSKRGVARICLNMLNGIVQFIERALVLAAIGIICGVMGFAVYHWIFLGCGICILFELHRSKTIANLPFIPDQLSLYWSLFVCMIIAVALIDNVLDPPAKLLVQARIGLPHPDTINGSKWRDYWSALRVDITNRDSLLNDLDLTLDLGVPVFAVQELDGSPYAQINLIDPFPNTVEEIPVPPGLPPFPKFTFRDFLQSVGTDYDWVTQWKIFCPHFPSGEQLRLLVVTPRNPTNISGLLASRLRLFGNKKVDITINLSKL